MVNATTYGKISRIKVNYEQTESTARQRISRQNHMFGEPLPCGWRRQFPRINRYLRLQRCMPDPGWRPEDPGQMAVLDMRMCELRR